MKIYAQNINTGGALVLVRELQRRARLNGIKVEIFCSALSGITEKNAGSWAAYKKLLCPDRGTPGLYFGNLPPLVRHINSAVYIHNPYLILSIGQLIKGVIKGNVSAKYILLGLYLRMYAKNCDEILVQTPTMQLALSTILKRRVKVLPFYVSNRDKTKVTKVTKYIFCAIGLPSKHKVYLPLLRAIERMVLEETVVTMVMTVPDIRENNDIIKLIQKINNNAQYTVIDNQGLCNIEQIWDFYSMSDALIFPSLKESFGLPLIEAADSGLTVFAPNLPYVDDVIGNTMHIDVENAENMFQVLSHWIRNGKKKVPAVNKVEDKGEELLNGDWYGNP